MPALWQKLGYGNALNGFPSSRLVKACRMSAFVSQVRRSFSSSFKIGSPFRQNKALPDLCFHYNMEKEKAQCAICPLLPAEGECYTELAVQILWKGGRCNGQRRREDIQGIVFCPGDPELVAIKRKTHNLDVDYNQTHEDEFEKRDAILQEILGEMGEGVRIQGPIAFHYESTPKSAKKFFGNFNLTIRMMGVSAISVSSVSSVWILRIYWFRRFFLRLQQRSLSDLYGSLR